MNQRLLDPQATIMAVVTGATFRVSWAGESTDVHGCAAAGYPVVTQLVTQGLFGVSYRQRGHLLGSLRDRDGFTHRSAPGVRLLALVYFGAVRVLDLAWVYEYRMSGDVEDDPLQAILRAGVTVDAVRSAVEKSGYPLQTAISDLLREEFHIQQEWGYRDRLTGDMRTIDIVATKQLRDLPSGDSRIRPHLVIIIECKQSDLPFVFFRDQVPLYLNFPSVCGLGKEKVVVKTDDDRSRWHFRPLQALQLDEDPFVRDVPLSSVVSKCGRRGDKLELTGSEAYNGLVMPLMSALHHFREACAPPATAFWFDVYLVVALAVLDAPMISAEVTGAGTSLAATTRERLYRHEPGAGGSFHGHMGKLQAIEIIQRNNFNAYLADELLPFAEQFATLAVKHHHELATGKAFASGLGKNSYGIEARMLPRQTLVGPPVKVPPRRRWFERRRS